MITTRKPEKMAGTRAALAAWLRQRRPEGVLLKLDQQGAQDSDRTGSLNLYVVAEQLPHRPLSPLRVVGWFITPF